MVWLCVCIHVMNQNGYLAVSEDVLAALPTRATRETNERQLHHSFQPLCHDRRGAVSHKV
jgi:hypothetical protein